MSRGSGAGMARAFGGTGEKKESADASDVGDTGDCDVGGEKSDMGTPWCSSGGVAALAQWLREAGIGTDAYGVGSAKSLAQLVEEVDRGETVLARQGGGRGAAIRCVRVASVFITSATGQVLIEERQVFPDGRERRRGLPLCEKLLAGEEWAVGMRRGIHEELASVLSPDSRITLDDASLRVVHEESYSQSYPDLLTRYTLYRVRGAVTGIPQQGSFVTTEPVPGGTLTSCWAWQEEREGTGVKKRA